MIKTLRISNFKSIIQLKLDCKRFNIFIGKPNTGKSNILESLGILSSNYHCSGDIRFHDFIRYESMNDLFYDKNLDTPIKIIFDDEIFQITYSDGVFIGDNNKKMKIFRYNYSGGTPSSYSDLYTPFKFYKFRTLTDFPGKETDFLMPPSGLNLLAILMSTKQLKTNLSYLFKEFGLKIGFKPQEGRIEVVKQVEDIFIMYPYSLISETLQRIVFYLAAIESNRDSIIIIEEPESHAFPYYTKFLAEKIAMDQRNNQYFISTHNPYFLLSIIEKAPIEDINIFLTYFEDFQTKIKPLNKNELEQILEKEFDIFFQIERFLEG